MAYIYSWYDMLLVVIAAAAIVVILSVVWAKEEFGMEKWE